MSRKNTVATGRRINTKRRKLGPIYSLPKKTLHELQRLCASDTPYREIADWLRTNFRFHVTEQIVFNWWKRKREQLATEKAAARKTVFVGGFKVVVDAPGAQRVGIEVLPQ
jgi:hypothetical protein